MSVDSLIGDIIELRKLKKQCKVLEARIAVTKIKHRESFDRLISPDPANQDKIKRRERNDRRYLLLQQQRLIDQAAPNKEEDQQLPRRSERIPKLIVSYFEEAEELNNRVQKLIQDKAKQEKAKRKLLLRLKKPLRTKAARQLIKEKQ